MAKGVAQTYLDRLAVNHFKHSLYERIEPGTLSSRANRYEILFAVDEFIVSLHQGHQTLAIVLVSTFQEILHTEMISVGRLVQGHHLLRL